MDQKPPVGSQSPSSNASAFIRTMQKDMEQIKSGQMPSAEPLKTSAPPAGLPINPQAPKPNPIIPPQIPKPETTIPAPMPSIPKPPIPVPPPIPTIQIPKPEFRPAPNVFNAPKPITPPIPPTPGLKPNIPMPLQASQTKPQAPVPQKTKGMGFLWAVLGIIVILILGAGGYLLWYNYFYIPSQVTHYECQENQCISIKGEGESQCATNDECIIEPQEPESLIPVSDTKTITLTEADKTMLLDKIKELSSQDLQKKSLTRILIKLVNGQKEYATLAQLIDLAKLTIYPEIYNSLTSEYTLFIYNSTSTTTELLNLGLVAKINEETQESQTLTESMKKWEQSIINDLMSLFLKTQPAIPQQAIFNDSSRKDSFVHRYINMPENYISIDYALNNNLLLISTSKESMDTLLDALK